MPTTTKRVSGMAPERRGQGRPVAAENDVGQERLLVAGDELLRKLPPARVADCVTHTAESDKSIEDLRGHRNASQRCFDRPR